MENALCDDGNEGLSAAMTNTTPLLDLGAAPADGGACGVSVQDGARVRKFIILRWRDELIVYRNRCPHAGIPLDWIPDRFFDRSGDFLFCASHGASFEPDSGLCVDGPCVGDSLERCKIAIQDNVITLIEPL